MDRRRRLSDRLGFVGYAHTTAGELSGVTRQKLSLTLALLHGTGCCRLLDIGESEAAHELSVRGLDFFYRVARVKFDADEAFKQRARARVVALQTGDERTRRLWRLLVAESKKYFLTVYDHFDVTPSEKDCFGESCYNDMRAPVVDELDRLGLLRERGGAACVFPTA